MTLQEGIDQIYAEIQRIRLAYQEPIRILVVENLDKTVESKVLNHRETELKINRQTWEEIKSTYGVCEGPSRIWGIPVVPE